MGGRLVSFRPLPCHRTLLSAKTVFDLGAQLLCRPPLPLLTKVHVVFPYAFLLVGIESPFTRSEVVAFNPFFSLRSKGWPLDSATRVLLPFGWIDKQANSLSLFCLLGRRPPEINISGRRP